MDLSKKVEGLGTILSRYDGLAVAFSGGVDSTYLLAMAARHCPGRVVAITARSVIHASHEHRMAVDMADQLGVTHVIIESNELEIEGFAANPADRCYLCKRANFGNILQRARQMGLETMAHGANVDDEDDYRPGARAAAELAVEAPLQAAGLTKAEIRICSREMGLKTWNLPAMACLASRVPYGQEITPCALGMIEKAEAVLRDHGFELCRVRHYEQMARIEVAPENMDRFLAVDLRQRVVRALKNVGYLHVALDLEGYVQGSLNRQLGFSGGQDGGEGGAASSSVRGRS